jgi:hypothetical protein
MMCAEFISRQMKTYSSEKRNGDLCCVRVGEVVSEGRLFGSGEVLNCMTWVRHVVSVNPIRLNTAV